MPAPGDTAGCRTADPDRTFAEAAAGCDEPEKRPVPLPSTSPGSRAVGRPGSRAVGPVSALAAAAAAAALASCVCGKILKCRRPHLLPIREHGSAYVQHVLKNVDRILKADPLLWTWRRQEYFSTQQLGNI